MRFTDIMIVGLIICIVGAIVIPMLIKAGTEKLLCEGCYLSAKYERGYNGGCGASKSDATTIRFQDGRTYIIDTLVNMPFPAGTHIEVWQIGFKCEVRQKGIGGN